MALLKQLFSGVEMHQSILLCVARPLLLLVSLSFMSSCIGVGHSYFSRGTSAETSIEQIEDPALEAHWSDLSGGHLVSLATSGTSRLVFEGIQIHIRPRNDQPTVTFLGPVIPIVPIPLKAITSATGIDYKLVPPFVISVSLDSFGKPIVFDTTKPVVRIGNEQHVEVKEALHFACNEPNKLGPISDRRMISSQRICVHLLFDVTPPHPNTRFVLNLEGLIKDEVPLRVPRIEFIQASSFNAGGNVSK